MTDKKQINKKVDGFFEILALHLTKFSGSTVAFIAGISIVIVWAASGPFFGFSEIWQMVINTGTTIITFLMVFIIQRTQNKDSLAIQLKLNELIASIQGASNRLVDVEDISEDELEILRSHYQKLAQHIKKEKDINASHSIEEAKKRHMSKKSNK